VETGIIIKSINFHNTPYWVVKCDNPNLQGNRKGELPINPLSHYVPKTINNLHNQEYEGRKVKFNVIKIEGYESMRFYVNLINKN
jgi:hypothetical protein